MKVTFFKGVSVSIYFMYLTQLSEKQTICPTPSLQNITVQRYTTPFPAKVCSVSTKNIVFWMRFFSSTHSSKNTTKSYKKFKAWKKPSFANEHQPRSQVFIVKPNSHVQIFQLIYILVFLVVWTVSLHGNKLEKPVFIVMSNFQTWPEASGNCLLLRTYLTWCACLQQGLPQPNTR